MELLSKTEELEKERHNAAYTAASGRLQKSRLCRIVKP
jgi:hypothetical protein